MTQYHTIISFEIGYAGIPVFCEAVLQADGYRIFLNNIYVADIQTGPDGSWQQTDGTILPQSTIDEVGAHIDGQLD